MKLAILLLFLTSTLVNAADERNSLDLTATVRKTQQETPGAATTSVSQQFEEADISLAVAFYIRLKEKANELRLKLALKKAAEEVDRTEPEEIKRKQLAERDALTDEIYRLDSMARDWRSEAEARASKSASAK